MATAAVGAMRPASTNSCQLAAAGVDTSRFTILDSSKRLEGATDSNLSRLSLVRIPCPRSLTWHAIGHVKANLQHLASNKRQLVVCSEYSGRRSGGAGDFFTGFLLGGVLFGAIGYLIAPTVSQSIVAAGKEETQEDEVEGPPKKLPKYVDDDEGLENTRKNLNEKIAELNAAIDDVSAQLRASDAVGNIHESA